MTRRASDTVLRTQLERFLRFQELQALAIRDGHISTANRHYSKMAAAKKQLAQSSEGRAVLEELLQSSDAFVRLRAGGQVIDWRPDMAIPVLARLMFEELPDLSAGEWLEIRQTAKGLLYNHFNIRSFDRNDLIEPLKAYGVSLPYRDHMIWQ